MEAQSQVIQKKMYESVEKNRNLLQQKKYYQFAQKFKLLANRKLQTSKFFQAQLLLEVAAEALFKLEQAGYNISFQLIQRLTDLLFEHPQLWDSRTEKKFYETTSIKKHSPQMIKIYQKVCKKLCDAKSCIPFAGVIVEHYETLGSFIQVQNFAVLLSYPRGLLFLKNGLINSNHCRKRIRFIAALHQCFEEQSQKYLNTVKDCIYKNFSRFLLNCVKLKSKKVFDKIGDQYRFLLSSDQSYSKIYSAYGQQYFGLEIGKKPSGLMSMLG